jgi:hypothetical protein
MATRKKAQTLTPLWTDNAYDDAIYRRPQYERLIIRPLPDLWRLNNLLTIIEAWVSSD